MGTPVPLRSREEQCKGADPKVNTRQLTDAERRYYDSLGKPKSKAVYIFTEDENLYIRSDKEMRGVKIDPPEKQVLIEKLGNATGKSKALGYVASIYAVSITTVYDWIKAYDIQFDRDGKVIKPLEEAQKVTMQESENETCSGATETDTKEVDKTNGYDATKVESETPVKYEYLEDPNDLNIVTLGVRPGDGQIIYPEKDTPKEASPVLEEGFVLLNKMYQFGKLEIDIQYDKARVVISDLEDYGEICLPFEKVKAFACNLHAIGNEVN